MSERRGLLLLEDDRYFQHLNVIEKIQEYGGTLLTQQGKEYHGACPFDDCYADDNGFMAWPELTKHCNHWHCRVCHRSGRLEKLIMIMEHVDFWEACRILEIPENVPDVVLPRKKHEPAVEDWQKIELVFLEVVYPAARRDISRGRGAAYLAQRGIQLVTAAHYDVGYLRPFEEVAPDDLAKIEETVKTKVQEKFHGEVSADTFSIRAGYVRRWFDSILYPVSVNKRNGWGYASRTLRLWQPGMDEKEHKALLEEHNSQVDAHNRAMEAEHGSKQARKYRRPRIARHLATHQRGFFNGAALATYNDIIFVEGLFDALSLLDAGIENVVDIGGVENFKEVSRRVLPASIDQATLAYDSDAAGIDAIETLYSYCRYQLGFTPRKCLIPADGMGKDWNERYQKHGGDGLACLRSVDNLPVQTAEQVQTQVQPLRDTTAVAQVDLPAPVIAEVVNAGPGDLRYVPCHMSIYGLCTNQVVEQDESTWRLSADGLVFCVPCWQLRRLEFAERAVPYLEEHGQPTDLETRIDRIMTGPGYGCCGGHDWMVDETGILVCRCVVAGGEEIARWKLEQRSARRRKQLEGSRDVRASAA